MPTRHLTEAHRPSSVEWRPAQSTAIRFDDDHAAVNRRREIQLLRPVLQTSVAADASYCRDVREKEELVASTIEQAAHRILANRRPRLISVRGGSSSNVSNSSAMSLSVASSSRSQYERGSDEPKPTRVESSHEVHSPILDDDEEDEGSDSEYTEVTISSDDDDGAPPSPPAIARRSDESAYTEVTVEEEPMTFPRASTLDCVLESPEAEEGSMPEPNKEQQPMDESLLQSPLALILEKRRRQGHAPWKPRHIAFVPSVDPHVDTVHAMMPRDQPTTKSGSQRKGGFTASSDTVDTLPLSPGSSFDVHFDVPPPPQADTSRMIGRLGWKVPDGVPAAPQNVSCVPLGPSPSLLTTPKHANRKKRSTWENPPHHPFLLAPTAKDPPPTQCKEKSPANPKTMTAASHPTPRSHRPPLYSSKATPAEATPVPATSTSTPVNTGTSAAVWEPRSRSRSTNERPVVLASTTELRPGIHRPRTVVVANHHQQQPASRRTRSTSRSGGRSSGSGDGGRRNAPIYEYGEYHDDFDNDDDDGDRDNDTGTAVSALTLDKKAYHVESPLVIDTDAILSMLESTASTTAASTSSSGGSEASVESGRRRHHHHRRRPSSSSKKKKTTPAARILAQSLGRVMPRSRSRSRNAPSSRQRHHHHTSEAKPATAARRENHLAEF